MDTEGSPQIEESMPDISPDKDSAEDELRDQGMWGKQKNVVVPEAFKAATGERERLRDARKGTEKVQLEDLAEFKHSSLNVASSSRVRSRGFEAKFMAMTTPVSTTRGSALTRFNT